MADEEQKEENPSPPIITPKVLFFLIIIPSCTSLLIWPKIIIPNLLLFVFVLVKDLIFFPLFWGQESDGERDHSLSSRVSMFGLRSWLFWLYLWFVCFVCYDLWRWFLCSGEIWLDLRRRLRDGWLWSGSEVASPGHLVFLAGIRSFEQRLAGTSSSIMTKGTVFVPFNHVDCIFCSSCNLMSTLSSFLYVHCTM